MCEHTEQQAIKSSVKSGSKVEHGCRLDLKAEVCEGCSTKQGESLAASTARSD